jgi:hypothetical protein
LNSYSQGNTCALATPITLNGACLSGTINDVTANNPLPSCGTTAQEGWYTFTLASATTVTISCTNASRNLAIQLIQGACPGTQVSCTNNLGPGAGTETVTSALAAGVYYIKILNIGAGASMAISNFCLTTSVAPTNDNCTGAVGLTVNPTQTCTSVTAGTIANSTASSQGIGGCGGTADDDVWFSFTATNSSHDISLLNVVGSTTDLYHSLWTGTCPTLTLVAGTCSDPNSQTVTGLTVGQTYFLRVYTWTSTAGQTSTFNVCIGTPPAAPSNDEPCSATPLTVGTSCSYTASTTSNSTSSSGAPAPGCAGFSGSDVWFSVVVPASGAITFDSNTGVITDGGMAIYRGTCGSLTLIECDDDDSNNGAMSMIAATGLIPGETIWIRFWEFLGDNNGTFSICAYNPCPPCTGAPTGGSATASPTNTTCAATTTTLSLTGSSTGCGFSYQWQSSPNNSTWINITGATSATYSTTISATTYFRCVITCIATGNVANSNSQMVTTSATPPANDEPCNATPITVGSSCTFASYTTSCASSSAAVPAIPDPGCAFYSGGDVWFTAVVPSGGSLTFDSNTGGILDAGMAIYTGTCSNLALFSCNDDGSANGAMPMIEATGLTPGSTVFIRFWEYGNDSPGTFSLCIYDPCPPCSGAPVASAASASPAITSCGAPNTTLSLAPAFGCTNNFQWQSSPDNVTWTNISGATTTTLTIPVTTATYFRCVVSCILSGLSTPSSSTFVNTSIANTCSFTVSTPAYVPDAAYTAGTLLTFPDDQMSAVLPIGFNFCFMGTTYTNFIVSSNAFISFNTANSGGYSSYTPVAIPSATPTEILNSIMFPWHDVDPSVGTSSDIRYITLGTAPNRKLVVNFSIVPMFSCNSNLFTAQVVLNETTNIIETYIQDKPVCSTWVGGRAVHGINGPDGCSGVTVPGRNNTVWTVTNDAKMFTPTGCCNPPLPAELTTFEGTQISKSLNKLNWTALSETNLDKYIIEKSENGMDFEYLGERNASGNSSTARSYAIEDNRPFDRVSYYRLKQVDFNGDEHLSNTIAINNSEWSGFAVLNLFPNPSNGIVNSEIYASEDLSFTLEVRDISGRIVKSTIHELTQGGNINKYDLTTMDAGIYIFTFIDNHSGKTTTIRFTKE